MVVDLCPQKSDPSRFIIIAGVNLIKYAGELTTRTADITTARMLWNSVISMKGAQFSGLDIFNFYLETPMNEYKYMTIPLASLPQYTVVQYDLNKHAHNGWSISKFSEPFMD